MENKLKDEAMGVHCEFVKMVSHTDFDESIHWAMKLGMPKDREHLPHAVVDRLAAIERGEETWPPERFQEVILAVLQCFFWTRVLLAPKYVFR